MTERPALSDYNQLLSFEERVCHVRFRQKVPKLYRDPAVCVDRHLVVRENGKIVAAIAAWPGVLQTPAGALSAVGIGSVAVDASCRGKGYMLEMMEDCDAIAAQQGAALGFLSGYRQRYAYYGYTPAGVQYLYEIRNYLIARAQPKQALTFSPLKDDIASVPALAALHRGQDAYWQRREEDFYMTTTMWRCRAYVVRDESGAVCGYIITERFRGEIGEMVLGDGVCAEDCLVLFARYKKWQRLRVTLQEPQYALRAQLASFAEHPSISAPAMFKVFDFPKVIETLGSWKAQRVALPAGSVVLDIDGDRLRVTVRDSRVTAESTSDDADLCLTKESATAALLSPFAAPQSHPLFAAWSPLCPLSLPHCDNI